MTQQPKKQNEFINIVKRIFVKDYEIKIAAVVGGLALWALFAVIKIMITGAP